MFTSEHVKNRAISAQCQYPHNDTKFASPSLQENLSQLSLNKLQYHPEFRAIWVLPPWSFMVNPKFLPSQLVHYHPKFFTVLTCTGYIYLLSASCAIKAITHWAFFFNSWGYWQQHLSVCRTGNKLLVVHMDGKQLGVWANAWLYVNKQW